MRPLLAAVALASAAGCATDLDQPLAPAVGTVITDEGAAEKRAFGVEMRVNGDPDVAFPVGTDDDVTAVAVSIKNHADAPVRVRYKELRLVESDGSVRAVLPALDVSAEPYLPLVRAFSVERFRVAPAFRKFYADLSVWQGEFVVDRFYYPALYPRWIEPLPTAEMVARAIPEGVLEPGGSIDGLLFFEPVARADEEVVLEAALVNAATGATLGTLRIPFVPIRDEPPFALK